MALRTKYLLIICLASALFLPFLGQVHLFDWDEINFAECAREMIVSKEYLRAQIDFMPFWEKPPFFIWMQVLAMKAFGVGEYAARLPNALIGVVTLVTIFYAGRRVVTEKMASWWVSLFAASWLPHFYFKTGIIDPTFNYFIFLSFFQVYLLRFSYRKMLHALLAGLFLGVAVLTKGPVALLIAGLSFCVYLAASRGLNGYRLKHLLIIAACALVPMLLWLATAVANYGAAYGKWFVTQFLLYQVRLFSTEDADHGGPFFYHFIVLLLGCFPASIFLFQYTRKRISDSATSPDFTKWMWILFWVVLLLFSIVKTKIVHYSSLCYYPLTYLAALQLYRLSNEPRSLKKWIKPMIIGMGTFLAIVITALPLAGIYKHQLTPYIHDQFAVANFEANVAWSYSDCAWGLLYLIATWVAVYIMKREFRKGMVVLCIAQIIIIQVALLHFTPKIEAYTQRSAIEYFKGFAGKNVYVQPLGYKSYANLFYTQKTAAIDSHYVSIRNDVNGKELQPEANEAWLLSGMVDRPTYFICKIQDAGKFREASQLQETGGSNGFVFFKRK